VPTADDITRWRDEAKVLRAAVVAGEEAACSRVLAAHPKYVGRSRERLQTNRLRFSLRDAQWTIAREHGSETWSALCDQGPRWPRRTVGPQQARAVRLAAERGDGHCGPEHLLMALAAPKRPTIASAVLEFVGADIASLHDRPAIPAPAGRNGVSTNPRCLGCVNSAVTFAIAEGADRVTDEHVLLALMYIAPEVLHFVSADPDEIYDALVERGAPMPSTRPPSSAIPHGPPNPLLYLRRGDLGAVLKVLGRKHPPGTEHWGFNYSKRNPDEAYIVSEDEIDIEAIVREALGNDAVYRLESFAEARTAESWSGSGDDRPSDTSD
jgi:hypothetical protein